MARYWPLGAGRVVTSVFGTRWGAMHWGTDFGRNGGSAGMPVYAAQAGTVVYSGAASGFGMWVVIDHPAESGSGTTVYGHVVPEVRVGQAVAAGQRVARINPDRNTNGGVDPHLHFEVHRSVWAQPGPDRLDPLPWLSGAREPGTPAPAKGTALDSPITRTDLSPNCHGGGRDVDWVAIHTQEGRGKARDIIPYLKNRAPGGDPRRAVSYNGVVDDVESVLVVPWHLNPWAASNANSRADHILLAGTFAGWERGKWLETDASDGVNEDAMLTRAAWLVAWRCQERGLPIEWVGDDGHYPPRRPGVCGHVDFGAWGGGHTDPGRNFPRDELIRRARAFAEGDDMSAQDVEAITKYVREFVTGYVGPLVEDVKVIRQQLTGSRDTVYVEPERKLVDLRKSFPGWPDLLGTKPDGQGGRTGKLPVDAIGDQSKLLEQVLERLPSAEQLARLEQLLADYPPRS